MIQMYFIKEQADSNIRWYVLLNISLRVFVIFYLFFTDIFYIGEDKSSEDMDP
jgi:hypothetical protein